MHSANLSDQQQRRQEIVEERGQKKKGVVMLPHLMRTIGPYPLPLERGL